MTTTLENASAAEPILAVDGLFKSFKARPGSPPVMVLEGVSFEIVRGETLGLVGESGSGKTTVGRCVVQLTQPTGGSITFNGCDLSKLRGRKLRSQRRHLQIVFQDSAGALDSRMTILQSVEESLAIHHIGTRAERRQASLEMLERVGLVGPLVDSKPHALSGGQLQRVAIARALVTKPDLLVLDEPVSALDVSVRAQILNLLRDLQQELGLSYLFIVHDLAVAEYFSDRVVVLYGGQVMETGPAETLFTKATHPYTQALLSAIPVPDPRVLEESSPPVPDAPLDASKSPSGCAFATRCLVRRGRSVCVEEAPPLESISDTHLVACHFVKETLT